MLAQEEPISLTEIFRLAHALKPSTRIPPKAPYWFTYTLASVMEFGAGLRGRQPLMQRSQVKAFYKADMRCNISKARRELGFDPRPTREALTNTLRYLLNR